MAKGLIEDVKDGRANSGKFRNLDLRIFMGYIYLNKMEFLLQLTQTEGAMRRIFASLIILIALAIATPAIAAESGVGRYQAILIGGKDGRSSAVFILDTQEGHIWTWGLAVVSMRKVVERITYKGRVRPGKEMGDIIWEKETTSIEDTKKP